MTDFLISKFAGGNPSDPPVRRKYGVLGGSVGITLNVLLFALKLVAGLLTASISITADALNNLSDAGSSIITLVCFKLSGKKADKNHPFGHGRIEYLAGLAVSALIVLMGCELLKSSIQRIASPEPPEFNIFSVIILAISVLTKFWMSIFYKKLSKKTSSSTLSAASKDSMSDAASTTAVLIGTVISIFFGLNLDGWLGVLVSLFILYTGISAARETLNPLLGSPPDSELVSNIEALVRSYPIVVGIHDLIVHDYGPGNLIISLHAEVPSNSDLMLLHDTIDLIEVKLREEFHCEATIHMDPLALDDELTSSTLATVKQIVSEISDELSIHDFRMVHGRTHSNLIFDVVIPYDFSSSDKNVTEQITQRIQQKDPSLRCIIRVDKSVG